MKSRIKLRENGKGIKGITLIALVITIIILLILAGISIASIMGENGILNKADIATIENRGATVEEEKNLWKSNQIADEIIGENNIPKLGELLDYLENEKLITKEEKDTIIVDGEITIGSRTIVFGKMSVSDRIESIVNKNKDEDGNIDYEKLKDDLNTIDGLIGLPNNITSESFPIVILIDREFMQIDSDGNIGPADRIDLFGFVSNANNTSLEDLGITMQFSNCEYTSVPPGSCGGGSGNGRRDYSWTMTLDYDLWFANHETASIEAGFAASLGENISFGGKATAYGAINFYVGESHDSVSRFGSGGLSKQIIIPEISGISISGWGHDPDYGHSNIYLNRLIINFE